MAFLTNKINFTKLRSLQTSKMELFVTIVDRWKLLTSVTSILDLPLLNNDIQRTEEDCSNVVSLVVYVDGGKCSTCNQDFSETT